ncbi:hypothetical protein V8V88_07115, partial [Paenibacillus phytohabitans]
LQVYRCREEEAPALPLAAEGRSLYGAAAGNGAASADAAATGPADPGSASAPGPGEPVAAADYAAASAAGAGDRSATSQGMYNAGLTASVPADLFADGSGPVERFADGSGTAEDAGAVRWINRSDMANYAFPNVFLKLLNAYFDEQEGGAV